MTKLRNFLFMGLFGAASVVNADECALEIEGNDQLQFSLSELSVSKSQCENVTLTLKHVGQLPAQSMGHNWVLTETANKDDVATAGIDAGLENNYVPQNDDRVLAATTVIGGGEETSVTFSTAALTTDGDYSYICSFPGHSAIMAGKLIVTE